MNRTEKARSVHFDDFGYKCEYCGQFIFRAWSILELSKNTCKCSRCVNLIHAQHDASNYLLSFKLSKGHIRRMKDKNNPFPHQKKL